MTKAKAIVDRLTPGMVEREPETIERWIQSSMDEEIADLRELAILLRDELRWCSGSADFNPGGVAWQGWIKGPYRALAAADILLAKLERTTDGPSVNAGTG
jgi:hypothetical protein